MQSTQSTALTRLVRHRSSLALGSVLTLAAAAAATAAAPWSAAVATTPPTPPAAAVTRYGPLQPDAASTTHTQRAVRTAHVRMLADLNPGPKPSVDFPPDAFHPVSGSMFFSAFTPDVGFEPRVSNGTADGTRLVADVVQGPRGSFLRHVATTARGTLLTLDNRGEVPNGPWTGSLWTTTTTADVVGETTLIHSSPLLSVDAVRFGDDALVHQSDFGEAVGAQMWRTDGTSVGTNLVKGGFILSGETTPVGARAFFLDAQNPLMVTDGTADGTRRVRTWPDNGFGSTFLLNLTPVRGRVFFTVHSVDSVGVELWVSDGTRAGTRLVRDINPGPRNASPTMLTQFDGRLFFVADDGRHDKEVWRSDGTTGGTKRVTDLPTPGVRNLIFCRDRLFFTTTTETSATLWTSTGRAGHQRRVATLPGNRGASPLKLTCLPGGFVFTGRDGTHGRELWSLAQGAQRPVLHDIKPGAGPSRPLQLTRAGATVFFAADDGSHGREVWTANLQTPARALSSRQAR